VLDRFNFALIKIGLERIPRWILNNLIKFYCTLCTADFREATKYDTSYFLFWESIRRVGGLITRHFGHEKQSVRWSLWTLHLKGLSHEICMVVFWLEWIYLGLIGNRFWFLNFKEGSSILDSYFKYWCVSYQTFSDIWRISEKDWQLSPRFSNFSFFWVSGPPRNAAKGVNTFRSFYESLRRFGMKHTKT
jgi:hypothetical protein